LTTRDTRQSQEQCIRDQRKVSTRAHVQPAQAPVCSLDVTIIAPRRLLRVKLDRPTERVHAGQGALRPAQYLDPIEIQQREIRAGECREVNVIDVDADTRIDSRIEIRLPNTTDLRAHRVAAAR